MESARTVIGFVGDVTSLALFVSPWPTFARIRRHGTVGDRSPLPYMAALLNSAVWVLYGLPMIHAGSMPVLAISAVGVAIQLVYMTFFFYYGVPLLVYIGFVLEIIFVAGEAVGVIVLVQRHELRSTITGVIGSVCSCAMYASPLHSVYKVCKSGSVQYLDRNMAYASLANAICWLVYSLLPYDPFILIPNSIGLLSALVQLGVYHVCNIFKDLDIEIELA